MDMDRVKRRIRGLLNLAEDDGAFDGEITAAMKSATAMMDQYQLERADVEAGRLTEVEGTTEQPVDDFATVDTAGQKKWHLTWEVKLSLAVAKLVGSVKCYNERTAKSFPSDGAFQRPEIKASIVFYGPAEDARMASELFSEWSTIICTMATGKYNGFCQGNGGKYAYGFACSLHDLAFQSHVHRTQIVTASTTALAKTGDLSLASVLKETRKRATYWLAKEKGVHLRSSGRSSGYQAGSHDAFTAGKADGSRANFKATRTKKLGGGA